jgi:ABC-type transport system substrate-binding protein
VNHEDLRTTEQIAEADLKSIGVQINASPLPAIVIFDPKKGVPSGNFDIVEFTYGTTGDPADFYESWRCGSDVNYTGYCSHTVDALLQRANRTLDPIERASLYRRPDWIMATQVPIIPMYQRPIALIHRSNLLGMLPNPGVAGPVWNIEDWHWKR